MNVDWEESWRLYRMFGDSILTTTLDWEELDRETLVDAADLLDTARREGGHVEANGELRFPGDAGLCADDAARWPAVWPLIRELLAFERQMEHDLAEVAHGR